VRYRAALRSDTMAGSSTPGGEAEALNMEAQ
jgi:hypothetical protein